jgi:hypothetical protein
MTLAKLVKAGQLRWHSVKLPVGAGMAPAVAGLERLFGELNGRYFGGELPPIPIRVSGRMRTRLGQLTVARSDGRPVEIAISRRHLERHDAEEVAHTLLHEMVHLWQCHTGQRPDHGPGFRARARELGIRPAAARRLDTHDVVRAGPAGG